MIICKPEEANQYDCCVKEGKCKGKSCMAWATLFNEYKVEGELHGRKITLPETQLEDSGLGYCGLVKE